MAILESPVAKSLPQKRLWPPGGDSNMEQTGMLVGNFEFNL